MAEWGLLLVTAVSAQALLLLLGWIPAKEIALLVERWIVSDLMGKPLNYYYYYYHCYYFKY